MCIGVAAHSNLSIKCTWLSLGAMGMLFIVSIIFPVFAANTVTTNKSENNSTTRVTCLCCHMSCVDGEAASCSCQTREQGRAGLSPGTNLVVIRSTPCSGLCRRCPTLSQSVYQKELLRCVGSDN